MKQLLIGLCLLIPVCGFSQIKDVKELIELRSKTLPEVQQALTTKGWEYRKKDVEQSLKLNYVCWSYEYKRMPNQANQWIGYFFDSTRNFIKYERQDKAFYLTALQDMKQIGYVPLDIDTTIEGMETIYRNAKDSTMYITILERTPDARNPPFYEYWIIKRKPKTAANVVN